MKGLAGLKRGLGYYTSRRRTRAPSVAAVSVQDNKDQWLRMHSDATHGLAVSEALLAVSETIGGAASAVITAIGRFGRDQQIHIDFLSEILDSDGVTPEPATSGSLNDGAPLERATMLTLGELCVGMSQHSTDTATARDATDGAERDVLDLIARDQLASADLGFLLWPLLRHAWTEGNVDAADDFAEALLAEALPKVHEPVYKRLTKRFSGVGLSV